MPIIATQTWSPAAPIFPRRVASFNLPFLVHQVLRSKFNQVLQSACQPRMTLGQPRRAWARFPAFDYVEGHHMDTPRIPSRRRRPLSAMSTQRSATLRGPRCLELDPFGRRESHCGFLPSRLGLRTELYSTCARPVFNSIDGRFKVQAIVMLCESRGTDWHGRRRRGKPFI